MSKEITKNDMALFVREREGYRWFNNKSTHPDSDESTELVIASHCNEPELGSHDRTTKPFFETVKSSVCSDKAKTIYARCKVCIALEREETLANEYYNLLMTIFFFYRVVLNFSTEEF